MALRYQRQKLLADHGGVKTYQGIDPLTGLPVLIYAFSGNPHLLLNELESENIPGILGSQTEGQQSHVVVAYARGYQLASRPLEMDDFTFLIESARALKDAAEIGVLHGDIRPERFWVSSDHVFVEGFGLPWTSEDDSYKPPERLSSFAGDIYSWAKSALHLTNPPLVTKPLLDLCLNQEPNLRPTAEQIYTALIKAKTQPASASVLSPVNSVLNSVNTVKPQGAPTGKTLEIDFTLTEEEPEPTPAPVMQPTMQGLPKPPSKPKTLSDLSDLDIHMSPSDSTPVSKSMPAASFPASFEDETLEPMVLHSDPGLRGVSKPQVPLQSKVKSKTKTTDSKQPFVKDLPPGATYRAGKADANANMTYKETPLPPTFDDVFLKNATSKRNSRRTFLLVGLFLGALILVGLVFFRQKTPTVIESNPSSLNYIVEVAVEPAGLSRVDLRIVGSPEGSKRKTGDILTTVPNQIVLDQAGIWKFQGEFQELKSEVVSLQLPDQRSMTIVMPIPPVTPTEEPPTPEEPATEPQTP